MSLQHCHLDACATLIPLVAFFHGICKQLSAFSGMTARQRLPSNSIAVGGNKTISSSGGGVSSTDRPICKAIYPSYGMNKNEGATIIVSYTWSQDAARMGSLVQGHNTRRKASRGSYHRGLGCHAWSRQGISI